MKGTEPGGSGKYNKVYDEGTYVCAGCAAPLYKSECCGIAWLGDFELMRNKYFVVCKWYARTERHAYHANHPVRCCNASSVLAEVLRPCHVAR